VEQMLRSRSRNDSLTCFVPSPSSAPKSLTHPFRAQPCYCYMLQSCTLVRVVGNSSAGATERTGRDRVRRLGMSDASTNRFCFCFIIVRHQHPLLSQDEKGTLFLNLAAESQESATTTTGDDRPTVPVQWYHQVVNVRLCTSGYKA
jgi:hypothetical protein